MSLLDPRQPASTRVCPTNQPERAVREYLRSVDNRHVLDSTTGLDCPPCRFHYSTGNYTSSTTITTLLTFYGSVLCALASLHDIHYIPHKRDPACRVNEQYATICTINIKVSSICNLPSAFGEHGGSAYIQQGFTTNWIPTTFATYWFSSRIHFRTIGAPVSALDCGRRQHGLVHFSPR